MFPLKKNPKNKKIQINIHLINYLLNNNFQLFIKFFYKNSEKKLT